MRKELKWISFALVAVFFSLAACNKEDKKKGEDCKPTDCFTCEDCQGQYGHLLNGEYCVDGFDNCEDWLELKKSRENESDCDCAFN